MAKVKAEEKGEDNQVIASEELKNVTDTSNWPLLLKVSKHDPIFSLTSFEELRQVECQNWSLYSNSLWLVTFEKAY